MQVKQFRYGADNFSYLIHGQTTALAIDPGAVGEILAYVDRNNLTLDYVTNTHMHPDHTVGNREIRRQTKTEFIENETLHTLGTLLIDGEQVNVFHTPGHTEDSFTFQTGMKLITGDTLFNGTVGNCFSGNLKAFYESIKILLGFSEETIVYAGHDYVKYAMTFARNIEPDNQDIDEFLKRYDPRHVRSSLADELKINPYLRFNDDRIIALLNSKGLPTEIELKRWTSIMEYY